MNIVLILLIREKTAKLEIIHQSNIQATAGKILTYDFNKLFENFLLIFFFTKLMCYFSDPQDPQTQNEDIHVADSSNLTKMCQRNSTDESSSYNMCFRRKTKSS